MLMQRKNPAQFTQVFALFRTGLSKTNMLCDVVLYASKTYQQQEAAQMGH